MTEGIFTIDEAAKYLNVSVRTIYDWTQRGEIPAGKIGNIWHFKRESIDRWMHDRMSASNSSKKRFVMNTDAIILRERIALLKPDDKDTALAVLLDTLRNSPQVGDHAELSRAALAPKTLAGAAMGAGVAIPHVRLPSITNIAVSIGVSRTPVSGFLPLDGEPVRLVIMVAAGSSQSAVYMQTISYFNARLRSAKLRTSLINAKDESDVYRLLKG
ncbi:MAG: helix-turn-helix domain-containing protein [Spirochaetaceae bacterium]|jgi:PTS system nitrogen regulatory IIA component|nr:helix-turn-helix domain-containing protein [Spirochaetaceae bacterium]